MRDISSRPGFTRASVSGAVSARGPGVSLQDANKIVRASERVAAKVEAHHAKHARVWTDKAYGDLLKKHGQERAPMPTWAAHQPQAQLMARAEARVAGKLAQRLEKVVGARDNLLQLGGLRSSRQMKWDRGLGY